MSVSLQRLFSRNYCVFFLVLLIFLIIVFVLEQKVRLLQAVDDDSPVLPVKPKTVITSKSENVALTEIVIEEALPNPLQQSKYAYITLLSGINPNFTHRGFLYNVLIMKKSLEKLHSTADFIVMVGFLNDPSTGNLRREIYNADLNLLKRAGIIIYELPRYLSSHKYELNFAEMALLKVTPFLLTQYEKIQYFDGDIYPTRNMDCFFQLSEYTFTVGAVSPLNSGWILLLPNRKIYDYFYQKALWRLVRDWDPIQGWGHRFPPKVFYTRGNHKEITLWDFNGADMDQGLFLYFFAYFYGQLYLIDTELDQVYHYSKGFYADQLLTVQREIQQRGAISSSEDASSISSSHHLEASIKDKIPDISSIRSSLPVKEALAMCEGKAPTQFFIHFTGHSKPWIEEKDPVLQEKKRNNPNVKKWMKALDDLLLPEVNSSTIFTKRFGAPVGFFNANFPKGGYKLEK